MHICSVLCGVVGLDCVEHYMHYESANIITASVFPSLASRMGPVLGTRRWLLVDKLEPDMLYRAAVMHAFTFMAVQVAKAASTLLRIDLFFSARLRAMSRRSARVRRMIEDSARARVGSGAAALVAAPCCSLVREHFESFDLDTNRHPSKTKQNGHTYAAFVLLGGVLLATGFV